MSRPILPAYKTRNCPAYNEALKRRGSLAIWFDPAMTWEAAPTGKRGRQPDYSDAAIQTCLTMKVLFGMALRQTTGLAESLLRLIGLDWDVPDFSTLSRRQKTLKVTREPPIPETVSLHIPFCVVKRGGRKEMQMPEGSARPRKIDSALVKALARAFRWKRMLESGEYATIHTIQLGGLDQCVGDGGGAAAGLRADEQVVLPSDGYGSHGALGRVVVEFEEAVVETGPKPLHARQAISDRHGQW